MISYYKGNLLDSGCEIIAHQVNLCGVFGGGLAKQIAQKYPKCEEYYANYVYEQPIEIINKLLGTIDYYISGDEKFVIANCFSQEENLNTNYNAIKECFRKIKSFAKGMKYKTIGVPFKYGCGIAKGDWDKVLSIFKELFDESEIDFQIWELIWK